MTWMTTISYSQYESLRLRLVGRCQYDRVTVLMASLLLRYHMPQLYFMQLFNLLMVCILRFYTETIHR